LAAPTTAAAITAAGFPMLELAQQAKGEASLNVLVIGAT
jgi:hypothetical protein